MTTGDTIRRGRSLLLGLFFLSQLAYLIVHNLLQFCPQTPPPNDIELTFDVQEEGRTSRYDLIQKPIEWTGTACNRWSEITGFWQGWKMFAPHFFHLSAFPIVEFVLPDGPAERVVPEYCPADPNRFFRLSDSTHRIFNFETRMTSRYGFLPLPFPQGEAEKEWKVAVEDWVRRMNRSTAAYLSWQTDRYLKRNPNRKMPVAVNLLVRFVPTPPPDQPVSPDSIFELPISRWRPGSGESGFLPVEAYALNWNEDVPKFIRLPRKEAP